MEKQQLIDRLMSKPGLRGKVNAFCVHCIYDPGSGGGNWRQQIEDCTARDCPLFDVRPLSSGKK